jgi:hypothetical protein
VTDDTINGRGSKNHKDERKKVSGPKRAQTSRDRKDHTPFPFIQFRILVGTNPLVRQFRGTFLAILTSSKVVYGMPQFVTQHVPRQAISLSYFRNCEYTVSIRPVPQGLSGEVWHKCHLRIDGHFSAKLIDFA